MNERPVECSQCKKPAQTLYKEIVGSTVACTEMCSDCPILEQKLHGHHPQIEKKESQLCCGSCETSLESVQMGQPLGCPECYTVFSDFLIKELIASGAISRAMQKKLATQRTQALHSGKTPDKPVDITLSSKLGSLNEALNDALKRENYEQAAWLRDQIKNLKEKKP